MGALLDGLLIRRPRAGARSEHVRNRRFLFAVLPELERLTWNTQKDRPVQSAGRFVTGAKPFREEFRRDGMGRFDVSYLPLNPRSRQILETDRWTAWDVVLDVWPDVFAWGVLLVPKDLKPGERRPVVVCQHGRNGVPLDTVDRQSRPITISQPSSPTEASSPSRRTTCIAARTAIAGCAARRTTSTRRCSRSSSASTSGFSTGWQTLPMVDPERIAFYGLSYGGETAVRVPTILEKYCLSICSGDFNQWTRKVAATDQPFSFMRTIEWEMPYWNMGQHLRLRGDGVLDGAAAVHGRTRPPRSAWAAINGSPTSMPRSRFLYAQLGLADRTGIEFFQGGHTINGQGTFKFLHEHLRWPEATQER